MTSNNSKGNESVRFKSSMSVDEIDFLTNTRIMNDIPGMDGTLIEMRLRLSEKAKQAIHQYVTKKQIEELERLDSHYWGDDDKDDLVDSLIGEHLADRIKKLEKQLEEWKS